VAAACVVARLGLWCYHHTMGRGTSADKENGQKQREPLLKPVAPRTITDQIAEQLRQLIISGEYKAGDRIPSERELADSWAWTSGGAGGAARAESPGLLVVGRGAQGTNVATCPREFRRPLSPLLEPGRTDGRAHGDPERGGDRGGRIGRSQGDNRRPAPPVDCRYRPSKQLSPEDDVAFHAPSRWPLITPCSNGSSENQSTSSTTIWRPSSTPTTRSPAAA